MRRPEDAAEQDEGQCGGLQGWQIPGDGGVQAKEFESGNLEDLLHGDGTADQGADGRQELREPPGQRAPERMPGDVVVFIEPTSRGADPARSAGRRMHETIALG